MAKNKSETQAVEAKQAETTVTEKTDVKADVKREPQFAEGQTITVLVKENPKRPNTKCRGRFEGYGGYDGHTTTVAEAMKGGCRRDDIRWDLKHGFIAVS